MKTLNDIIADNCYTAGGRNLMNVEVTECGYNYRETTRLVVIEATLKAWHELCSCVEYRLEVSFGLGIISEEEGKLFAPADRSFEGYENGYSHSGC